MPAIVTVNVSQQVASAPSTLQSTGALITQGGTTLDAGVPYFLSSATELSAILAAPSAAVTELTAMVNTYFSQAQSASVYVGATAITGSSKGIYVLDLGSGTVDEGVTALGAYITNPVPASNINVTTPVVFYSYLIPTEWDQNASFLTFANTFDGTTAQTYFYVTTTLPEGPDGYNFYLGVKSIFCGIQSPDAPSTEFSLASMFYVTLNYAPSSTNLVAPLEWHYVFNVTPYVLTNTEQAAASTAGVNWISTGAEGGISNKLIVTGGFMDKNTFNYWYAIDWLVINVTRSLSAAVIIGSNTPSNPLYYNQAGINSLLQVAQATVDFGITYGMILSPAVVTAIPFTTYVQQNPADYASGTYAGFACTFTPQRGFASIVVNLVASNIPT